MPIPLQVWGLALAAVAGGCALLETRIRARRDDPRVFVVEFVARPDRLRDRLRAVRIPLLLFGAVTWLAATPMAATPAPVLTVLGLAVGLIGVPLPRSVQQPEGAGPQLRLQLIRVPEAACAAAVVFTLVRPDAGLLLHWALPVLAGYLVRLAHTGQEKWRSLIAMLDHLNRWGQALRPPRPVDRFWFAVSILTIVSPMAAILLEPYEDQAALQGLCAGLVATQLLVADLRTRPIHRWVRRMVRAWMAAAVALAAVVAAGPVGAVVAEWWEGSVLSGWLGGIVLSAVVTACVRWNIVPLRPVTRLGLFPFWTAAVFHPAPGVLQAAFLVIQTELFIAGFAERGIPTDIQRRWAAYMIQWTPVQRLRFFGPWLHEVLRHGAGFDLARIYLGFAVQSARGRMIPGVDPLGRDAELREPLTGLAALRWTQIAAQALDLAETEVLPRAAGGRAEAVAGELGQVRAELALSRALVLGYAEQWADAVRAWREANERYRALSLPELAATCRVGTAWVLLRSGEPEAAHKELIRIPPGLQLAPGVLKWVYAVAGLCALAAGDDERAAVCAEEGAVLPAGPLVPGASPIDAEVLRGVREQVKEAWSAFTERRPVSSPQVSAGGQDAPEPA
ncbi:hypothetical protein [Nonomuraea sp. NPDC049400]|uniref:hypothetical protein n=1 Tax=Nonomuraea sp. NPDC049400 TaxID=3364352 RepID=UPI0037BCD0F2